MKRCSSRQQLQGLDVARPHRPEMAVVEGGELRLAEALDDRQNGAVDKADLQVGVGAHQLGDTPIVLDGQVLDLKLSGPDRVEQGGQGICSELAPEKVVDLDQDGTRHDPSLGTALKKRSAASVLLVVSDHRGNQGAGVEDQRYGSGSKTPSLASLLKSPRPELNAPINENGGCSPSSLGAPSNSCSSASRRSSGTSTPRSRAARRARSKRSVSISTFVFGVAAIDDRVAPLPGPRRCPIPSSPAVTQGAAKLAAEQAGQQATQASRRSGRIWREAAVRRDAILPRSLRHTEVAR